MCGLFTGMFELIANFYRQLIVGRIVQALGVCATSLLARAIGRDLHSGVVLARALSLIMVVMAAAPGFSPLLGGAFNSFLGWRASFWLVAVMAIVLAVYYVKRLGETQASDRRTALTLPAVLRTYGQWLRNRYFIAPALFFCNYCVCGVWRGFAADHARGGCGGLQSAHLVWYCRPSRHGYRDH